MKTWKAALAATAVALSVGVAGCERDRNPYGVAYRTIHRSVVGAYRPLAQLVRRIPELPDDAQPVPGGGDIRLVFGSWLDMSGRLELSGFGVGGGDLAVRFYGRWEYDVVTRRITMHLDQNQFTSEREVVLQVTLLENWVRLEGVMEIAGQLVEIDLGKSYLDEPTGGGGGGFGPA